MKPVVTGFFGCCTIIRWPPPPPPTVVYWVLAKEWERAIRRKNPTSKDR